MRHKIRVQGVTLYLQDLSLVVASHLLRSNSVDNKKLIMSKIISFIREKMVANDE